MRNESSITLDEFKEQLLHQILVNSPSANVSKENVTIKVKLTEDAEPIDFHSFKVVINV